MVMGHSLVQGAMWYVLDVPHKAAIASTACCTDPVEVKVIPLCPLCKGVARDHGRTLVIGASHPLCRPQGWYSFITPSRSSPTWCECSEAI